MKKSTYIANVAAWAALAAACVAYLIWCSYYAGPEAAENIVLVTLSIFAKPVGAFSIAALATTVIVRYVKLRLTRRARIVWRVLGLVPMALLLLSPFVVPVLPDAVAAVFAAVLLMAATIPVAFLLFGAFYGLSLAEVKVPEEESAAE